MRRGTTPTIKIDVKGCNLADFDSVYVTFKQKASSIDKFGDDLDIQNNAISILLSQEDTLKFDASYKYVDCQQHSANSGRSSIERRSDHMMQISIEMKNQHDDISLDVDPPSETVSIETGEVS